MNNLTTDLIRKTKWEFYGVAGQPLYVSIYSPLYTTGFIERYGMPTEAVALTKSKHMEIYIKSDQLTRLAEKVLPLFLEQQWDYYDAWKAEETHTDMYTATLNKKDLTTMTDAELRAELRAYRDAFTQPFITNNVIEPLSFYFQVHLKTMLVQEGVSEERAQALTDRFGQSAEPSYVKKCAEAYRNVRNPTDVQAVLEQYHYIRNDYTGAKPVTEEDLKQIAATTPLEFAKREYEDGISEKARALLTVLQIIATMQDVRKYRFLEMISVADRFGREFARRANLDFSLVECATWEEVEAGAIREDVLRDRQEVNAMYWSVQGTMVYSGVDARRIADDFDRYVRIVKDSSFVQGVCASKGNVRGKVAIVFQENEFSKVQTGDILVTMMTRPEFLPVMHKAAAFVCDEGGITSHAAIVAREMKKPCVIGTKIGSKVFKDGDMVEVDATGGIVRKL